MVATPPNSARGALTALSLSILMSSLGTSIANVTLPTLTEAFDASFQDVQWVVLAYLLAVTTLVISVGRLGDLLGKRRLLLVGIVVFTLASALCAIAPTLWILIAARAAQGLGAAVMMALGMALVGDTMPKTQTGRAMGLLGTMSAVGTAMGPSLGGILVATVGWRAIFLVTIPLGVAAFLLTRHYLPVDTNTPAAERPRFDSVGTILLVLTLGAYALALTSGRGSFGWSNAALLVASVVGLGLFLLVESKTASPLIVLKTFNDPVLSASLAMSMLVSAVMMATLVVGPFYLSGALGLPPAWVGIALSTGPIVTALVGIPAGRLTDRLGAQRLTLIGLSAMILGCSALALGPQWFGVVGYIAPIAILTVGYSLFQTANNTAVMAEVGPAQRGVVSGMLNLSRNLGLVTGASLMGAVFATTSARAGIAVGFQTTFVLAAVLISLAFAAALTGRATARRRVQQAKNLDENGTMPRPHPL